MDEVAFHTPMGTTLLLGDWGREGKDFERF